MASLETRLRDVQSKLTQIMQQLITVFQSADWKGVQNKLLNGAWNRRTETSFILLVLDLLLTSKRKDQSTSTSTQQPSWFGKILVGLNGYTLLAFALKDAPTKVWKDVAGLTLQGPDAETVGSIALGMIGASGAVGIASGLASPSEHILSVLSLALTKLVLGFFLINRATNGGDAKAAITAEIAPMLEFGRHHARTGAVVLFYVMSLVWRGRGTAGTPRYITDLEKRLTDRLDQLVMVVKDQKSRIDAISPTPTTPKRY